MQRPPAMPPRSVPLSLRVANQFNMVSLIGWGVLGFGSLFLWTFAANADLSFLTFHGELKQAAAKITKVERTNASENDVQVVANHYQYSVAGKPFQGIAYASGQALTPGEEVKVDYKASAPAASRIPGMRRAIFSPYVLFVVIIPLIGLGMAAGGLLWGRRRDHLLSHGLYALGTLKAKNPTNMTVNKMPVWELVFEFTARDGRRCEATARTTDTSRLEDERQEPLLYDPHNPSLAMLLDESSSRPRLDDRGELLGRPLALARLLLPILVLAANGAVLALR